MDIKKKEKKKKHGMTLMSVVNIQVFIIQRKTKGQNPEIL